MSFKDSHTEIKTSLISKNITVCERRTSVRLEPEMWGELKNIAKREKCTIHDICSLVAMRKGEKSSLTAAIRVFLLLYFRAASTELGHQKAGHGNFNQMCERVGASDKSNSKENRAAANGNQQNTKDEPSQETIEKRLKPHLIAELSAESTTHLAKS